MKNKKLQSVLNDILGEVNMFHWKAVSIGVFPRWEQIIPTAGMTRFCQSKEKQVLLSPSRVNTSITLLSLTPVFQFPFACSVQEFPFYVYILSFSISMISFGFRSK